MARYEDLMVGEVLVQTGEDRYPTPIISIGDDEEDGKPLVAQWRCNLVTASKKFNLYFAAFKDKIHVYIPRGIEQLIPSIPDLILDLPVSEEATSGEIDASSPHCVNNMVVGELGDLEILLMACDDGETLAYYTHVLNHHVTSLAVNAGNAPVSEVQPFFHQNVHGSAWGLAVHSLSRMIAVSSNERQVTVFMFAESPFGDFETYPEDTKAKRYQNGIKAVHDIAQSNKDLFRLLLRPQDKHKLTRDNINIRMVLDLGYMSHNVPAIDFVNDCQDFATHVIAVDITGKLWYMDLSDGKITYEKGLQEPGTIQQYEWGWGILNIPIHCFKKVTEPANAIGYKPDYSASYVSQIAEREKAASLVYVRKSPRFNTPEGSAILRAWGHAIQLLPPTHQTGSSNPVFSLRPIPVGYSNLIRQEGYNPRATMRQYDGFDRLNMYVMVEELNIVIIASQIGRAAILTLTRLPDTMANEPVTCIRRDAIVPFIEDDKKYRPHCPLHGIAVTRIPRSKSDHAGWANESLAFRLWLHYQDHTILSYEISRENHDALKVF